MEEYYIYEEKNECMEFLLCSVPVNAMRVVSGKFERFEAMPTQMTPMRARPRTKTKVGGSLGKHRNEWGIGLQCPLGSA